MKRSLLIACCFVLCASMAFAQAGSISIFSDQIGTDCNLWDNMPGLCNYYVVYVNHGGATAVQYAAPQPPCLMAMWLTDTYVLPVNIGNSQTGISTGFGGCYGPPTLVLTIQYFCQALTGPCCYYPVVPHPLSASGLIEATDCTFMTVYPTGGQGIVNPSPNCGCDVPVHETTWGQLKALYR